MWTFEYLYGAGGNQRGMCRGRLTLRATRHRRDILMNLEASSIITTLSYPLNLSLVHVLTHKHTTLTDWADAHAQAHIQKNRHTNRHINLPLIYFPHPFHFPFHSLNKKRSCSRTHLSRYDIKPKKHSPSETSSLLITPSWIQCIISGFFSSTAA